MMPIRLNLLPARKKIWFASMIRFLFIKEMLEFTIFTCAIMAIAHLLGWLLLTQTLNDLASSSLLVNREYPIVNQDIRQINKLTKDVATASANYGALSPYLVSLAQTLPTGIVLSRLDIDHTGKNVNISGVAKTRDVLLDYQNVVSHLSWLESASAPAPQLFQKEDIGFDITARLKENY